MANDSQFGFWAEADENNEVIQMRRVRIASNNGTAIFFGDCLKRTAAGVYGLATAGGGIAGVAAGASYYDAGQYVRKEAPYLPASTTYSSTAFDTYGETDQSFVYTQADAVGVKFRAQNPGTPALTDMTKNVNVDVSTNNGSTVTGISGHILGSFATTQGLDFAVVDFVHSPRNDMSSVNAKYIVQINALPVAPGSSGATGV